MRRNGPWTLAVAALVALVARVARVAPAALVALVACVACGGPPGSGVVPTAERSSPPPIAETCATRLPPRASSSTAGVPSPAAGLAHAAFAPPRSTIIVHAELPLAGLGRALEAKVPRRVAEERDRDLGIAGRLEYTVDRGRFAVRVEGGALVVEAPLMGRAQACAKGRCYAGCAPEARILARVPLKLRADYKLATSEVRIDVTKGCEVRALGGLVKIDVTPMLRGALAGQARTVQASIDRELPDFRPQAERLWAELSRTRPLPLGMCVALAPEEIAQGPAGGTAEVLSLHFGLRARPEVRVKCAGEGASAAPSALPPLRDDGALPALGDVHLGIVLSDDAPARAMERGEPIDLGRARSRVRQASGDVSSGLLLDLAGEACGTVGVDVGGVAWSDPQSLHLEGASLMPGERERLGGAGLEGGGLVAGVSRAPIALPIAVGSLETILPELARGLSDDNVTIAATVESSKPESAGLRGSSIVAVALVRGAVTLRAK